MPKIEYEYQSLIYDRKYSLSRNDPGPIEFINKQDKTLEQTNEILKQILPDNILNKIIVDKVLDNDILELIKLMITNQWERKYIIYYINLINKFNFSIHVYNTDEFIKAYLYVQYESGATSTEQKVFRRFNIKDINILDLAQQKLILTAFRLERLKITEQKAIKKAKFDALPIEEQQKIIEKKKLYLKQHARSKEQKREIYMRYKARHANDFRTKRIIRNRWARFEAKFDPKEKRYWRRIAEKKYRVKKYIELTDKRRYSTLTDSEERFFQWLYKIFKHKIPTVEIQLPQHVRVKEYKPIERKNSMANLVLSSVALLKRRIKIHDATRIKEAKKIDELNKLSRQLDQKIMADDNIITPEKVKLYNKQFAEEIQLHNKQFIDTVNKTKHINNTNRVNNNTDIILPDNIKKTNSINNHPIVDTNRKNIFQLAQLNENNIYDISKYQEINNRQSYKNYINNDINRLDITKTNNSKLLNRFHTPIDLSTPSNNKKNDTDNKKIDINNKKPTSANELIARLKEKEFLNKVKTANINNTVEQIKEKQKQQILKRKKDIKVIDIDITTRTFYDWANIYNLKLLSPCDLFEKISEYEFAWHLNYKVTYIALNNNSDNKELRLNLINTDIFINATEDEKEILKNTYIETKFIKSQLYKKT